MEIWKTQQWPQDWKRTIFTPIQRRAVLKNVQTTGQLDSSPMLLRVCLKFSKLHFSITWTENFQMFKLGLEKVGEPEIKLPIFAGSQRKQRNSRKTSTSVSLTTLKPLTVWIIINCGEFLKRWEYQTILPVSWETCMRVKKQQLVPYMEQLTSSGLIKDYNKAFACVNHNKLWKILQEMRI